jgi:hypothetical protein
VTPTTGHQRGIRGHRDADGPGIQGAGFQRERAVQAEARHPAQDQLQAAVHGEAQVGAGRQVHVHPRYRGHFRAGGVHRQLEVAAEGEGAGGGRASGDVDQAGDPLIADQQGAYGIQAEEALAADEHLQDGSRGDGRVGSRGLEAEGAGHQEAVALDQLQQQGSAGRHPHVRPGGQLQQRHRRRGC